MRKSFLWVATALSGVMFAASAHADPNQIENNGTTRERTTSVRTQGNGNQVVGSRQEPCPPRQVLTAAQRRQRAEAARRARDQRQAEEDARRAELDRLREGESQAQSQLAQARDAAARADAAAAQAQQQQAETQRALAEERAHRLQLASILAERERIDERHRLHRDIVARGGGPLHYRPMFTFGFDGGVAGFANTPLRDQSYVGGSWGARLGIDFADWFGIEGRYFGMANALYAPNAGTGSLVTNGGSFVTRLTVPTRWVQPYGFIGVGGYFMGTYRPVENQNTLSGSKTFVAVPVGLGLNFPIGRVVSIAAEGTYHALWDAHQLNTSTSMDISNGIWNGTAVLRFRL